MQHGPDVFGRGARRIVNALTALAWRGTPRQYARCIQCANLLANVIGARECGRRGKRVRRSRRKVEKKPD